jgi:hypothetical protein
MFFINNNSYEPQELKFYITWNMTDLWDVAPCIPVEIILMKAAVSTAET